MRDYVRRRRWIRTRIRKPQLDGSQFGDGGSPTLGAGKLARVTPTGTPRSEAAGGPCLMSAWHLACA